MKILVKILVAVISLFLLANLFLVARYYLGKSGAAKENAEMSKKKIALEPVDRVEIIPVVDYIDGGNGFKTEDGSSVLVKTDNDIILFDVGYNKNNEETSPLLYNLNKMGINMDSIDALAISHNHPDHVGGLGFRDGRIEITNGTVDLKGKAVFSPVPMTCRTANVKTVEGPGLIGKDTASTGPLAVQMFITGRLAEQALMVNVKGKGLVVISGCGHPQITDMARSATEITGLPVYAVVGGAHLYYTKVDSGFWRSVFGSNKPYCAGLSREEVVNTVNQIKNTGVKKVYLSPHDSDEATRQIFADVFGRDYETITVGRPITI